MVRGAGEALTVGVPVRQMLRVGGYLFQQKLAGREKFPLLVKEEEKLKNFWG